DGLHELGQEVGIPQSGPQQNNAARCLFSMPESHLAEVLIERHEHPTFGQGQGQHGPSSAPLDSSMIQAISSPVPRASYTASAGTFSLAKNLLMDQTGSG